MRRAAGCHTALEKYVEEMIAPVRVKDMLESAPAEHRQTLLLYWALATSAHKASDKIGTGALTGAELCASDSWTTAECAAAKAMISKAAQIAQMGQASDRKLRN